MSSARSLLACVLLASCAADTLGPDVSCLSSERKGDPDAAPRNLREARLHLCGLRRHGCPHFDGDAYVAAYTSDEGRRVPVPTHLSSSRAPLLLNVLRATVSSTTIHAIAASTRMMSHAGTHPASSVRAISSNTSDPTRRRDWASSSSPSARLSSQFLSSCGISSWAWYSTASRGTYVLRAVRSY